MKITIKQYEYEKVEIEAKEIDLPTEISYYFETGIRRSIKITPVFTSWNKERFNKEEEVYVLDIICLYNSSECKAEKFSINVKDIEKIFYSEKHKHKSFIDGLVNEWFDVRTKEQFNEDFNYTMKQMHSNET